MTGHDKTRLNLNLIFQSAGTGNVCGDGKVESETVKIHRHHGPAANQSTTSITNAIKCLKYRNFIGTSFNSVSCETDFCQTKVIHLSCSVEKPSKIL